MSISAYPAFLARRAGLWQRRAALFDLAGPLQRQAGLVLIQVIESAGDAFGVRHGSSPRL